MPGVGDPTKVPQEVRADIVARYNRGRSLKDIAFAVDKAPATVSAVLRFEGVLVKPKGIPQKIKNSWYRRRVA